MHVGGQIETEAIAYLDGQVLVRTSNDRFVLETIERHIQLHVAEHSPRYVFVHAGVIGWNGQAVVVPGRTFSGKSTLVAALLRAGGTYYSDEFAVVDRLGRIHPYQRPIHMRDANGQFEQIDPAKFSARIGRKPIRARLILITYHRERARWRPRQISRGEGMLTLLSNTVSARRDPKRALRSLSKMLSGASLLQGARGEADSLVDHLVRSGHLPD